MTDGRAGIDAGLVGRLVADQFPQWAGLPIVPAEFEGWDNRTYRLGDRMTVRLPTAEGYAAAVDKENLWIPRLAPGLPVAVPPILGRGRPAFGYAYPWSIRGWLPGETAGRAGLTDRTGFAADVAAFIRALQLCDPVGGPEAGRHSWYRGCPPGYYDEETRRCLARLDGHPGVDTATAAAVWAEALAATWTGAPVWFHGDIAVGNLLVVDGRLSAVIDFGTSGVGDPACDLVIAWTFLTGDSRRAFREAVAHDDATWARARGWALWKALLVLVGALDRDDRTEAADCERVIAEILRDR
ncbi:aminoglycoside phosphotransferase family protein [Actinoplanes couchii]|uniref:Aminoglycoside phosphotransferase n=1 Tax=Actinoplanes couchii TaxID=403638 RepID=A0ABQ3XFQ4_9ACTN|nr:aminoglycoside phosphotransferase family protein [Actinoplanes couchii]MDR6321739.1 aminoglycoside phosphotransferase (APT) family kinase protein [Actinoplanes couchii]GID57304.1 aminoglycoside phosphotransferase [Actinoplanes couchii]